MTAWADEVARHRGHLLRFRDAEHLDCRECARPIVIPVRADLAGTRTPPPFTAPDTPPATPEVIAAAKTRALAELELVRQRRTTAKETDQ